MKITEPYSPSARAKASAKPVSSAGVRIGRMTRVKVCQRVAPSVAAASSTSFCRSSSTGCRVRTTNGRPMKVSATHTPSGVKLTLNGSQLADPAVARVERGRARCRRPPSAARTAGRPARRRSAWPGTRSAPAPRQTTRPNTALTQRRGERGAEGQAVRGETRGDVTASQNAGQVIVTSSGTPPTAARAR